MRRLQWELKEYEQLESQLYQMRHAWEDYDDPMSDPGLQFELEEELEQLRNQIKKYLNEL